MATLEDLELIVYDFEVFAHDWLLVAQDVASGETLHWWQDDAEDLFAYLNDREGALWVSFNGAHYDQWVMKAIVAGCTPEEVKEVNDAIIGAGPDDPPIWEHEYLRDLRWAFHDVDLMKDTLMGTSLKSLEGHLGMSVEESEVDFTVDHPLSEAERADVLRYCEHDVSATRRLLDVRRGYLETKLSLGERAGLEPAQALRLTNAKLTAVVLGAVPPEEPWDDEREYVLPANLRTEWVPPEALAFFSRVTERDADGCHVVPDDELWRSHLELEVGGCPVTLGFGGIHGALPCYRERERAGRSILNIDVSSYYPSLMVVNGYTSRNMADPRVFEAIYRERLAAKARGDKQTANDLKLVVNTTYGATLNRYNDLYDPLMARSVCISGQLYLLQLACELVGRVASLELIQLNTDGVMVSVDTAELGLVRAIYHAWESQTGFSLEEDDIAVVWQKDVNNYAMRTTDGHEKVKGGWLVRGVSTVGALSANNNATVVADALRRRLLDGVPVRDTVMACDDPAAFQLVAKVGHKYREVYLEAPDGTRSPAQRCNRVYAARDPSLGRLYKVKAADGSVAKVESLPDSCLISNGGWPDMGLVDRDWYVALAERRALAFQPTEKEAKLATAKATDHSGKNVWQKLALARKMVAESGITKGGVNDYDGWTYMELGDIVPVQNRVFAELGLVERFTYVPGTPARSVTNPETGEVEEWPAGPAHAVSLVVNADAPGETIEFRLAWPEIKPILTRDGKEKQNAVQLRGSEQTYLRRYLKMQVLDLAVPDEVDKSAGAPQPERAESAQGSKVRVTTAQKAAKPKASRKPPTDAERAKVAKAQAAPEGHATQLQVRQLRKSIRTLKDAHGDSPEVGALVAEIGVRTGNLKGEFTKTEAEGYILQLGELKQRLDEGGEE